MPTPWEIMEYLGKKESAGEFCRVWDSEEEQRRTWTISGLGCPETELTLGWMLPWSEGRLAIQYFSNLFQEQSEPGEVTDKKAVISQEEKGCKAFCGSGWPWKNHCFVLALSVIVCPFSPPDCARVSFTSSVLGFTLSLFYNCWIWATEWLHTTAK